MVSSKDIDQLIYFGDSLGDSGRAFALSSEVLKVPIPPASEGYAGQFSNGPVQSLYTAALLDVEASVYAVGGAQAAGSRTVQGYLDFLTLLSPNSDDFKLADPPEDVLETDTYLGGQVDGFLADVETGGGVDENTSAIFFIGVNDYGALFDPSRPTPPTEAEVAQTFVAVQTSIATAVERVLGTGIDQVFLYNLPDASFFPLPPNVPPEAVEAANQVIQAHNGALEVMAAGFRTAGADVETVDINRIAQEITDDPRTFGFRPEYLNQPVILGIGSQPRWNSETQQWELPNNPAVADVDPSQLPFYDFLHPTTAAHGVLGIFAAESLTGSPRLHGGGNDVIRAGASDDLILSGAGSDQVFAGGGNDTVLAGRGNDLVWGGSGDDIIAGGSGRDLLLGGNGNDVVAGSAGNDAQYGGRGNDLMVDGLGFDILAGGSGNDAFLYIEAETLGGSNATDGGLFHGGRGRDTLYLALTEATRAEVEAELDPGAYFQRLDAVGVRTWSIEEFVFIEGERVADEIQTAARIEEADLWGIV
jgi:phospholipase/lecithinase/hemolysin